MDDFKPKEGIDFIINYDVGNYQMTFKWITDIGKEYADKSRNEPFDLWDDLAPNAPFIFEKKIRDAKEK